MPRHPGPLIRRRQTRATLIIIRVYRKSILKFTLFLSIAIRTCCLLLFSAASRSSEVHGGSQGRSGHWILAWDGSRLCRSSILWCFDNLDPGLAGPPRPSRRQHQLTYQPNKDCRQEEEREGKLSKAFLTKLVFKYYVLCVLYYVLCLHQIGRSCRRVFIFFLLWYR